MIKAESFLEERTKLDLKMINWTGNGHQSLKRALNRDGSIRIERFGQSH
jgi:hypothetical protein